MITRETIDLAYRLILGRAPESDAVLEEGLTYFTDLDHLRATFLSSEEFRTHWFSRYFRIDAGWVLATVLGDLRVHLNLSDSGVSQPALFGTYQPETIAFIEKTLDPDRDFLDFGANIGLMSLVAARKIARSSGRGRVHAFEPNPDVFPWLIRSIGENGFAEIVRVLPCAAADRVGMVPFHSDRKTNFGSSAIVPGARIDAAADVMQVPAVRAEDVLPEVDPGLVKIDVEGAEPLVVAGLGRVLERSRPVVLCEINDEQLRGVSGRSAADLVAQFAKLGYRVGDEAGDVPEAAIREKARRHGYFDVVFRPG